MVSRIYYLSHRALPTTETGDAQRPRLQHDQGDCMADHAVHVAGDAQSFGCNSLFSHVALIAFGPDGSVVQLVKQRAPGVDVQADDQGKDKQDRTAERILQPPQLRPKIQQRVTTTNVAMPRRRDWV